MKVILLQDVPKIGKRFEVKNVADGYAANFLIPRKLAEAATDKKVAALETKRAQESERAAMQTKLLREELQKLSDKTVNISAKANEQGHLFKGLHTADIASVIEKEHGVKLTPEALQLAEPIKKTGEHELVVSVEGEKTSLKLSVTAEG